MIKFEITYKSTFSIDWPKLYIVQNNKIIHTEECNGDKFIFELEPQDVNVLEMNWFNKTERHTIVDKGTIKQDQTFTLKNIRVDNIQIENWFMTEGYYQPRYFKGFLEQQKANPEKVFERFWRLQANDRLCCLRFLMFANSMV